MYVSLFIYEIYVKCRYIYSWQTSGAPYARKQSVSIMSQFEQTWFANNRTK